MGKRKASGTCLYCGINPATTEDHVIAECLFSGHPPPLYVKVPACKSCNKKKSLNDDYLRDMLVMDADAQHHEIAQSILKNKAVRSTSPVANTARRKPEILPAFTESGLFVGLVPTIPLDTERVTDIFSTIVRGLYYRLRKERLPDDYYFEVRRLTVRDGIDQFRILQEFGCSGPYCLGANNDVFCCQFVRTDKDDPFQMYWLLVFYNSIFLTVTVERIIAAPTKENIEVLEYRGFR